MDKFWAVVPAAGTGQRFGSTSPKQYTKINGRYLIDYCLDTLLAEPRIECAMVSLSADDRHWSFSEYANDPRVLTCLGGEQRVHSVFNALWALRDYSVEQDWVLVHDAARPLLNIKDLKNVIDVLHHDPVGGILACQATDSIKQLKADKPLIHTSLKRENIYYAQTPQMFRYQILLEALRMAIDSQTPVSDESVALENKNMPVRVVSSQYPNAKITHPEDLIFAQAWLDRHKKKAT